MSANSAMMKMEDDALGASEMATALFMMVGDWVVAEPSPEMKAVLRCVSHLQAHTVAIVRIWNEAVAEDRAA